MSKYFLPPQAQRSLQNIKDFSLKHFGPKQTKTYLEQLLVRMKQLCSEPQRGKIRSEIKAGYYSYHVGSHTIYYKRHPDGIAIIDVLHQSMDPDLHL